MKSRTLVMSVAAAVLLVAPAHAGALDPATLWPHADGLAWTYAQRSETLVPPSAPVDRTVRALFDGTVTTPGGFEAQFFTGQLLSGPAPEAAAGEDVTLADPFLRTLVRARPDLRAAVLAKAATRPCALVHAPGFDPVLLSPEAAFRVTATEVCGWRCDVADLRAWQWLGADFTPGATFTLQMIPDVANNVFLHGTVGALESVTVPAGAFASCVRMDYVVDYGTTECLDQNGNPLGTYRSETRGSIHFAPNVGPVRVFEEFVPYVEATGGCAALGDIGQPEFRATLQLTALPVATAPTTWGRLKTLYR